MLLLVLLSLGKAGTLTSFREGGTPTSTMGGLLLDSFEDLGGLPTAASALLAASVGLVLHHRPHRERWHISSCKAEAGGDSTARHFRTQILLLGSHVAASEVGRGSKDQDGTRQDRKCGRKEEYRI